MAGRGPTPKKPEQRLGKHAKSDEPLRGEWKAAEGVGWQHGPIPEPPDGLLARSVKAWETWFGAWYAAHWGPEDLPALHVVAGLYDNVARGKHQLAGELRHWMDGYGMTPKGRQDRRWAPPADDAPGEMSRKTPETTRYAHLVVVDPR